MGDNITTTIWSPRVTTIASTIVVTNSSAQVVATANGQLTIITAPQELSIPVTQTATIAVQTVTTFPRNQTQPQSGEQKSPGTSLSAGAVAGISIGTAIAGAAIGALLVFLLMWQRNKKGRKSRLSGAGEPRRRRSTTGSKTRHDSPGRTERAIATPAANLDLMFAPPLDDGSVKAAVDSLRKRIEDHADSRFYHFDTIDESLRTHSAPGITSDSILSRRPDMQNLLYDPQTRLSALKAVIAFQILAAIDFEGTPARTLLPRVITEFLSEVSPHMDDDHATRVALSRWRTSTSHLLRTPQDDKTKEEWRAMAELVVQSINALVQPYANAQLDDERNQDLFRVCNKATQIGMQLFSQPAEWCFDWDLPRTSTDEKPRLTTDEARSRGRLVVFPSLIKVTNNSARMNGAQMVLDARVARV